jgi:adenine deaminase
VRNFFEKLKASRGEIPVDMLVKNGKIINVLSGEIIEDSIAIFDGRIVGFGEYEAREILDADGMYIAPGFIDAHIHFESTMLSLNEFTRAVLPHGTTSVVIDPHEIANVLGLDGIRYVLNHIGHLPLDVFVMLPSCVPATPLETSGAEISHHELQLLIHEKKVAGIGEMMNFPAVLNGDDEVHWRINAASGKKVDGHAPGITGKDLNAYILSGIDSDHESTSAEEALEKVRKGMHVHVREGTSEKNLVDILPVINEKNAYNFSFASDDKHPEDLVENGHIDHSLRKAIQHGLDPMIAYQMATIFTARHYNLKNLGGIFPRAWADFLFISDFKNVTVEATYKKGKLVAKNGQTLWKGSYTPHVRSTMDPGEIKKEDFQIPAEGENVRVIEIIPGQIVTKEYQTKAKIKNNLVVSDTEKDVLKILVIERHRATRNIGKALVHGLGLKRGALGSTIAHDSHNIVLVGVTDDDLYAAFEQIRTMQGGLVVVENGKVLEKLPLPIAGLLSDLPFEEVVERQKKLNQAAKSLGCIHPNPFMILSFLSLSPIPKLKVTDQGLIDAELFSRVNLFVK